MNADTPLTFGKHKGKTINDLLSEGELSYIVWMHENVSFVHIDEQLYRQCKERVYQDQIMYEAWFESNHSDWGNRD